MSSLSTFAKGAYICVFSSVIVLFISNFSYGFENIEVVNHRQYHDFSKKSISFDCGPNESDDSKVYLIRLQGEVKSNSFYLFQEIIERLNIKIGKRSSEDYAYLNGDCLILELSSSGGNFLESTKFIDFISENQDGIVTMVNDEGKCYSACANIFISAKKWNRYMYLNSQIGFHAPYLPINKKDKNIKISVEDAKKLYNLALIDLSYIVEKSKKLSLPRYELSKILKTGSSNLYMIDTISKAISFSISIANLPFPNNISKQSAQRICSHMADMSQFKDYDIEDFRKRSNIYPGFFKNGIIVELTKGYEELNPTYCKINFSNEYISKINNDIDKRKSNYVNLSFSEIIDISLEIHDILNKKGEFNGIKLTFPNIVDQNGSKISFEIGEIYKKSSLYFRPILAYDGNARIKHIKNELERMNVNEDEGIDLLFQESKFNNKDNIGNSHGKNVVNPSFDCVKARSETEKAICQSDELSRLDSFVAKKYVKHHNSLVGHRKELLISDQKKFLKKRNQCRSDAACLSHVYNFHLHKLNQLNYLSESKNKKHNTKRININKPSSYWNHNGSVMAFHKNATERAFVYSRPKPNLDRIGIRRGTVLFRGHSYDGKTYSGQASTFSKYCRSILYEVRGRVNRRGDKITLRGTVPTWTKACRITGYRTSVMEFNLLD